MNIEIANRLVNLRKSNNLSQEALAEKLGISRQAVSKWERAEASPDTDNLILLARLYGISLDELLKTEDEIPRPYEEEKEAALNMEAGHEKRANANQENREDFGDDQEDFSENGEYVHIGFQGVHVKDKDGEVHIGWDGIHVEDRNEKNSVHIDKKGVYVNGERYDRDWLTHHIHFPIILLIILTAYLVIGFVWGAWHPGWLLVLLIPVWDSLVEAIEKKNAVCFAYPVLAVLVFLALGIFLNAWHPGWVVFLTIPLYYSLVKYIHALKNRRRREEDYFGDE